MPIVEVEPDGSYSYIACGYIVACIEAKNGEDLSVSVYLVGFIMT
jgi:hypothetical protein